MTATLPKNVLRVHSVLVFIKIEGERASKKRSHGLFFKKNFAQNWVSVGF